MSKLSVFHKVKAVYLRGGCLDISEDGAYWLEPEDFQIEWIHFDQSISDNPKECMVMDISLRNLDALDRANSCPFREKVLGRLRCNLNPDNPIWIEVPDGNWELECYRCQIYASSESET